MSEKTLIIEGYQPVIARVDDGYQPILQNKKAGLKDSASSGPVVKVTIIPPKGGTGEVQLKKK
jgi:hypothetical protein